MDGLDAIFTRLFEETSKAPQALSGPTWLGSLRGDAFARYRSLGLPTTKLEDWKYSSLTALSRLELGVKLPRGPAEMPRLLATEAAARLTFVNGRLDRSRCNFGPLAGVTIASVGELASAGDRRLERALTSYADPDGVKALNSALFTDGVWIDAAPGTVVDQPIHVLYLADEGSTAIVRNVIHVGERAQIRLSEEFVTRGARGALTCSVTQIEVAKGGVIRHLKTQHENAASGHLADIKVEQARDSLYESLWASFGGLISRNEIHSRMADVNAECRLLGLYAARSSEQVDSHTVIEHAAPSCRSYETYKGILSGEAKGSFTGRIVVRKDAQKTDSHQLNRNLLLSERAIANTRPQLQIHADDVKCSHGATVGRLDAEQLFYLRSRGIGFEEARKLISRAFAGEVLAQRGWPEGLGSLFDCWLSQGTEAEGA